MSSGDTRGAGGFVDRDLQRHSKRKPSRCPAKNGFGLHEQQRVAPLRQQQVSRETADDRARSRTQRFANSLRRAGEDRLQLGDDTGEHETDLPRDQP